MDELYGQGEGERSGKGGGSQRHEEIDLGNSDALESQPWERP